MINLLYIGNSSTGGDSLNLNAEYDVIKKHCAKFPESIALQYLINPRLDVLIDKLKTWPPNVIHFGGHGSPHQEIAIITTSTGEVRAINNNDFLRIIEATQKDQISLLMLNSCYGESFARLLQNAAIADAVVAFRDAIRDDMVTDYLHTFYGSVLSGETIQDAVELANIGTDTKASIIWDPGRKLDPAIYRLTDPEVEPLQEGAKIEGKNLIKLLQVDDLGSIWQVSDGDTSKFQIRRFLHKRINRNQRLELEKNVERVKAFFKDEAGVLIPSNHNLDESNPKHLFIEYASETKLLWKPLHILLQELENNYPLNRLQIDEVNAIILQLAGIIDMGHYAGGYGLIHGRLNPNSIILVDRHTTESSTFGNLRPIITDFGLDSLSSRLHSVIKNQALSLSPWVKAGKSPRKEDDVYSLVSLWFWMLTGRKPQVHQISDINSWYKDLKVHLDYDVVSLILDVVNNNEHRPELSALKLSEQLVKKFITKEKIEELNKKTSRSQVKEITNGLGMKFSQVKAGKYYFGADRDEINSEPDEYPRRLIFLNEFYISQCVMTIQNLIDLANESGDSNLLLLTQPLKSKEDKNLPVTSIYQDGSERKISWQFAKKICTVLSELDAEKELGYKYFLPTEAQWEVACRAETITMFNTGLNELNLTNANFKASEAGLNGLQAVGKYPPNKWNLYEMHGNVWEFCEDYYQDRYLTNDDKNPKGAHPKTSMWTRLIGRRYSKVIRGGDYQSTQQECRSANRAWVEDKSDGFDELHEPAAEQTVGIRLVCYPVDLLPE